MRKYVPDIAAFAAGILLVVGLSPVLGCIPDWAAAEVAFENEVSTNVPRLLLILLGTVAGIVAFAFPRRG